MLLSMKACGLPRYSDTSIWSSDTPGRCVRPAMRDSVSPLRTRYSSTPDGAGCDGASAVVVALGGTARRSPGAGFGAGVGPAAAAGAGLGAGVAATGGAAGVGV